MGYSGLIDREMFFCGGANMGIMLEAGYKPIVAHDTTIFQFNSVSEDEQWTHHGKSTVP